MSVALPGSEIAPQACLDFICDSTYSSVLTDRLSISRAPITINGFHLRVPTAHPYRVIVPAGQVVVRYETFRGLGPACTIQLTIAPRQAVQIYHRSAAYGARGGILSIRAPVGITASEKSSLKFIIWLVASLIICGTLLMGGIFLLDHILRSM